MCSRHKRFVEQIFKIFNLSGKIEPRKSRLPQGFGSAFFFADPDPGNNFHADPGEGGGGKGKNEIFFDFFFTFQMILTTDA